MFWIKSNQFVVDNTELINDLQSLSTQSGEVTDTSYYRYVVFFINICLFYIC